MSAPRVLRVGDTALMVELADGAQARSFRAEAERRRGLGEFAATDLVPAARTVLIDGLDGDVAANLAQVIPGWHIPADAPAPTRTVTLPVIFDGPDLADVAAAWGVGEADVPHIITAATLDVAFCGFAPGFAYLAGLGRQTPRRASPRTAVPAGAVGLAGEYAGVYPRSSPGGWQIVGTLAPDAAPLWDPTRDRPALLEPGTAVRFVRAGEGA